MDSANEMEGITQPIDIPPRPRFRGLGTTNSFVRGRLPGSVSNQELIENSSSSSMEEYFSFADAISSARNSPQSFANWLPGYAFSPLNSSTSTSPTDSTGGRFSTDGFSFASSMDFEAGPRYFSFAAAISSARNSLQNCANWLPEYAFSSLNSSTSTSPTDSTGGRFSTDDRTSLLQSRVETLPTTAVFLLLAGVVASQTTNVKNTPAAGYGAPAQDQAYYPPPPPPTYVQVPYLVPQPPPPLVKSHICATEVGYVTYGGERHHLNRHSHERTCDDVFMSIQKGDNNTAKDAHNCQKCCKSTAHLNGFSINDVTGMTLIVDKEKKCTCCAPAYPRYGYPQQPYGIPPVAASPPIEYGTYPAADPVQPTLPPASPPASGY